MKNLSKRIGALSPEQLKLLQKRLQSEGIDIDTDVSTRDIGENKYPPIEPVEEKEYYPLSSVQRRLFTINQLETPGTIYNVSSIKIIEGNLDKKRVEEAFEGIVKRHEAFRTSFVFINGEPVQQVHKPQAVEFEIEYNELTGPFHAPCPMLHASTAGIVKNFIRPFDLSKAPLLRVGLIKCSEARHILMYDTHHIVSDGISKGILAKEFVALYKGEAEALPELKIQYKDFCQWLNTETLKAVVKQQESYWLKQLEGDIPVLNLPADYPRSVPKSYEGGFLNFKISNRETAALKMLALKKNTTLFVILLGIYNVFLAKLSRQEDIIVGIPMAGRRQVELNDIIGMFVNTITLRNFPAGEKTFEDFLDQVKLQTLDAFENQDYQFEDLVNKVVKHRDVSRNPIFDVFFSFTYPGVSSELEQELPQDGISQLTVKAYEDQVPMSMFDLYMSGQEKEEELFLGFTYAAKLFKKRTVARFIGYFKEIVSSVIQNNRVKLKDIKISHHLGIAASALFQDEDNQDEGGFGF